MFFSLNRDASSEHPNCIRYRETPVSSEITSGVSKRPCVHYPGTGDQRHASHDSSGRFGDKGAFKPRLNARTTRYDQAGKKLVGVFDVLKPHLKASGEKKGTVVIGVIEGDTHDIGKNMVRIMLETGGFEVHDLGRDVPPRLFVDKAKEVNATIIALSTLMTTTMDGMGQVVRLLQEENIRDGYKVMVGGGPISPGFAKRIGADGYAVNAAEAVKVAKELAGAA